MRSCSSCVFSVISRFYIGGTLVILLKIPDRYGSKLPIRLSHFSSIPDCSLNIERIVMSIAALEPGLPSCASNAHSIRDILTS